MGRWNDPNLIPPSGGGYLKLKQGENKIRIISEAEVFGKHFKHKKSTICIGKDEGCELCQEGDKPKPSWLMWVIDRADNQIKMFEAGYMVVSQIQKLAQSSEYGFGGLPGYDMFIQKEGESLETEYTVTPARKDSELTEEEKESIAALKSPETIVEEKKKGVLIKEAF